MKLKFTLLFLATVLSLGLNAQSLMDLKEKKAGLEAQAAEAQAALDAVNGEIAGVDREIELASGWTSGFSAVAGFGLNRSSNWAKNANPNNSNSNLSINGSGFMKKEGEKAFWRNSGTLNLGWQKIDPDTNVEGDETDFDRNVDLLNIASLAGYKLSDAWALSGLGELNTSVGSLFKPGSIDLGVGATFTGVENLVVVFHPLNYHLAFPADGSPLSSSGFLGLKVRADYFKTFNNGMNWTTNLTAFAPYSGGFDNGTASETSAFEWTWLNTVGFPVWNGIGFGVSFGLRNAAYEYDGTQNFYAIGLNYAL